MQQIYKSTPMPKCKATLLKSHYDMGVLLYIAAYFQNTFSWEHLWMAASVKASMNIYLIPYMQHDESTTITLKYFLRYSFLWLTLRRQTRCMILSCQFDSYEDVFSCLSG